MSCRAVCRLTHRDYVYEKKWIFYSYIVDKIQICRDINKNIENVCMNYVSKWMKKYISMLTSKPNQTSIEISMDFHFTLPKPKWMWCFWREFYV